MQRRAAGGLTTAGQDIRPVVVRTLLSAADITRLLASMVRAGGPHTTYDGASPLSGCVNDVAALTPLLARNEDDTVNFACESIDTGGGDRVDRDYLIAHLKRLLAPSADVALFYFAGHGEGEGNDVTLVTTDGTEGTRGVKMSEVLALVAKSKVPEVNIVLDCCFSGGAGGVPQLASEGSFVKPGVSILTASRADQTADETPDDRGLFSWHLCAALEGGAADVRGNVTLAGIWAYLSESFGPWDQRPTFKANIDRAHVLRTCGPFVKDEILRQLATSFPTPEHDFPLDPSYEDTAGLGNAENDAVFKKLQRVFIRQARGASRRGVHVLRGDEPQGMQAHAARAALPAPRSRRTTVTAVGCTGHQQMPELARMYADRTMRALLQDVGGGSSASPRWPPERTRCSR